MVTLSKKKKKERYIQRTFFLAQVKKTSFTGTTTFGKKMSSPGDDVFYFQRNFTKTQGQKQGGIHTIQLPQPNPNLVAAHLRTRTHLLNPYTPEGWVFIV